MPEMELVELVTALSSQMVEDMLTEEDRSFGGLVGLPILRLGEYGGNKDEFWFQHPHTTGINP